HESGRLGPAQAVLVTDAQILAQGLAFVLGTEQAALLQDGDDSIGESVHAIGENAGDDEESVGGAGLKPFLHVVGDDLGRADGSGW
ncbi:hypothetical protein, partial [Rhodococcus sp. LB1]|uniref:hypothetical protein n=1 Tax=Rhodococcus sp. LB1 TaxID=1807499 RepID=UPI001E5F2DE9